MVADKHSVTTAQAAAMGMLAPAEGVAAMQLLLHRALAGTPGAVLGAASPGYWRLLLREARRTPGLFGTLGAAPEVMLRTRCTMSLCQV